MMPFIERVEMGKAENRNLNLPDAGKLPPVVVCKCHSQKPVGGLMEFFLQTEPPSSRRKNTAFPNLE
jgi:hypothetical protein